MKEILLPILCLGSFNPNYKINTVDVSTNISFTTRQNERHYNNVTRDYTDGYFEYITDITKGYTDNVIETADEIPYIRIRTLSYHYINSTVEQYTDPEEINNYYYDIQQFIIMEINYLNINNDTILNLRALSDPLGLSSWNINHISVYTNIQVNENTQDSNITTLRNAIENYSSNTGQIQSEWSNLYTLQVNFRDVNWNTYPNKVVTDGNYDSPLTIQTYSQGNNKDKSIFAVFSAEYEYQSEQTSYQPGNNYARNNIMNVNGTANYIFSTEETPTQVEVVDIPGLMFIILGMPFAWISTAFNLTLFPGTPYAINVANVFFTIIGALLLIYIIKKLIR